MDKSANDSLCNCRYSYAKDSIGSGVTRMYIRIPAPFCLFVGTTTCLSLRRTRKGKEEAGSKAKPAPSKTEEKGRVAKPSRANDRLTSFSLSHHRHDALLHVCGVPTGEKSSSSPGASSPESDGPRGTDVQQSSLVRRLFSSCWSCSSPILDSAIPCILPPYECASSPRDAPSRRPQSDKVSGTACPPGATWNSIMRPGYGCAKVNSQPTLISQLYPYMYVVIQPLTRHRPTG